MEFQLKFEIENFQGSRVRAQLKKFTKMWTKVFDIIRSSFFMSIFELVFSVLYCLYWRKWFVHVILYSPWSADLFESHLFGYYFYVKLWTANNASLFSVHILRTVIITIQYLLMLMRKANNAFLNYVPNISLLTLWWRHQHSQMLYFFAQPHILFHCP